jgi:hypothetical protein
MLLSHPGGRRDTRYSNPHLVFPARTDKVELNSWAGNADNLSEWAGSRLDGLVGCDVLLLQFLD